MSPFQAQHLPLAGILAPEPDLARTNLAFAGLADDSQSSYRRGPAAAPGRIRSAYNAEGYNSSTEDGLDLKSAAVDLGDWTGQGSWPATFELFRSRTEAVYKQGLVPFFAGGDHAVSVPVIKALGCLGRVVHVIQLDAHPDLYPDYEGNPDSHACTGRLILEMDHVASLTQVGLRTMTPAQAGQARRFGERLRVFPARRLADRPLPLDFLPPEAHVYLTVDLDALDPAFAPGVSHPVHGGLTSRQVLSFIQDLPWRILGLDVVELNPDQDLNDLTAVLAGGIIHEAMGRALRQRGLV